MSMMGLAVASRRLDKPLARDKGMRVSESCYMVVYSDCIAGLGNSFVYQCEREILKKCEK
ncbi:hypothetical protein FH972_001084 [Carpinus fangiana]|uniref:Uncharacterized protein n=1 Tax=Carpinus fangiana TaxID=176857 RepID=A0A5N6QDT1_9ROSI|nr:hypothetical protein FH972_001084 [Carpinus fangiana]